MEVEKGLVDHWLETAASKGEPKTRGITLSYYQWNLEKEKEQALILHVYFLLHR